MATQIFVLLPVKDLNKSVDFFTQLGYTFNPQLSLTLRQSLEASLRSTGVF